MNLRDRIGYDAGTAKLEDALIEAATHGVHYINFNADIGANHLGLWSEDRVASVKQQAEEHDIHLCLHTLSAVNIAEISPVVSEAADRYLERNIDLAEQLNCYGLIVHGGYHFNSEIEARKEASLRRLKKAVEYAENKNQTLFLENLNLEPNDAEVHYLAHTIEETRFYLEAIDSKRFCWSFTVNHANLVPEGINGFLDYFGIDRIGEVRLADNLGDKEIHMNPGEGNIDFESVFRRIEAAGYSKFYSLNFGSLDDRLAARETFSAYG